MIKILIQDKYNNKKTWEIAFISHGYYLRQYICGQQYGRGARVSLRWCKSIGLFDMKPIKATIKKTKRGTY